MKGSPRKTRRERRRKAWAHALLDRVRAGDAGPTLEEITRALVITGDLARRLAL